MQEPLHGEDNDGLWKVLVVPAIIVLAMLLLVASVSYYYGFQNGKSQGTLNAEKGKV